MGLTYKIDIFVKIYEDKIFKKKVTILTAHSLINSSHSVSEDKTDKNLSQSSVQITTFKFALIQVTMRVWGGKNTKGNHTNK